MKKTGGSLCKLYPSLPPPLSGETSLSLACLCVSFIAHAINVYFSGGGVPTEEFTSFFVQQRIREGVAS